MKYMTILDYNDGSDVEDKVYKWIEDNEEEILEIISIEYENKGNIYFAIITYEERKPWYLYQGFFMLFLKKYWQ